MSSIVTTDALGNSVVKQIVPTVARRERITEADITNPTKALEVITRIDNGLAEVQRTAPGDFMAFEDQACSTAGTALRLEHHFGRRVEWQVTRWTRTTPGGTHGLEERLTAGVADSDDNTLVLASYVAGIATIRVF